MSRAEKLLARMRASKADWSPDEALAVYRFLGFEVQEGAKHTRVQHPEFPWLLATIKRSRVLPTGYIETLLELEKKLRDEKTAAAEETDAGE